MYPKVVSIPGNIELVQNSGVQFIDFDIMVDWENDDKQNIANLIKKGNFYIKGDELGFILPKLNTGDSKSIEYFDVNGSEDHCFVKDENPYGDLTPVKLQESLKLFDGAWIPLPYISDTCKQGCVNLGPTNWARARIVKVTDVGAIREYLKSHRRSRNTKDRQYQSVLDTGSENFDDDNEYKLVVKHSHAELKAQENFLLKEGCEYYRITLAFDTKTYDREEDYKYLAPTNRDVESGMLFRLSFKDRRCIDFVNGRVEEGREPWVDGWVAKIFSDLYRERIKDITPSAVQAQIGAKEHQAHYYNLLSFIGFLVAPGPVRFISNSLNVFSHSTAIDVSLVLDIGNARSCGILVEDNNSVTVADDSFAGVYPLVLRDLNAPERVYDQSFVSQIEFSAPNFEYEGLSSNSGRLDAFAWPSMVRVGQEATNLAAIKSGNEGKTGLVSPKRYLWSTDRLLDSHWVFNPYSYQIESNTLRHKQSENAGKNRAQLTSMGRFFNSHGKAIFALTMDDYDRDNTQSLYSYRSTMTFMLIEILMQALTQINSFALRNKSGSSNVPRRLKAIILTTPPCMSIEEKELYRSCVFEAIGILWKSLGFDTSASYNFSYITSSVLNQKMASGEDVSFIKLPMPEVHMDWDEAESGQVVYIYNESVKTFAGHGNTFIKYLRRPMAGQRIGENLKDSHGKESYSARIASLDIGGGTTDLVIKDYQFKKDVPYTSEDIIPVDIYKDGFKIAGDDIVHDLIKQCILPRLAIPFAKNNIKYAPIFDRLVGDSTTDNSNTAVLRTQFTQQILVKIAYKLMFHMEHLDPYAHSCVVMGTVADFILDRELNEQLPNNVVRPGPYPFPNKEVIDYVDNVISATFANFEIMNFKLKFDVAKINRAIFEGARFDICRVLSKLGEVLTTFNVDLLLLTGRSSKIPAIRSFFLQRLNLPSSRIVAMHNYRCESWYPFLQDGEVIGDPKTTAAVGALISYLRYKHNKFTNFRYLSMPATKGNSAHFVGILDAKNRISEESVLYEYVSAVKVAQQKGEEDIENVDSKFKRVGNKGESFTGSLAVQLGYRLLDDPDVEANPLYIIEAYRNGEDTKAVKQALSLSYSALEQAQIDQLFAQMHPDICKKYQSTVNQKLDQFNSLGSNSDELKAKLMENLQNAITAEVKQQLAQDPQFTPPEVKKSILGKIKNADEIEAFKQRYEAEYNARCRVLWDQREKAAITDVIAKMTTDAREALEGELYELLNNAINENLFKVRNEVIDKMSKLEALLNKRSKFEVTLKVVSGKNSPYPVPFIANCSDSMPNLPKVETFALESVFGEDGVNYSKYMRMYLRSVSAARIQYFMDSGTIDISGLNPRYTL